MRMGFQRRYLDLLGSIYLYNEHRGYTALDRVLQAVRTRWPDDAALIAQIANHRADERKHYLMFRSTIDLLDTQSIIDDDRQFEKLCRVISLTEQRGFRQVEILLRHPIVRSDARLMKIFRIIHEDEPSHWAPYDGWLERHGKRMPGWWERAIDSFIHSELLLLKLPLLFFRPGLARRVDFADDHEASDAALAAPALAT